jgi:Hemopexin
MPVTCALAFPNGKAYLFQGTTYSRYDFRSGLAEASGVAIAGNWPGLPPNAPDAAVLWGVGKIYFFYDDEYLRYDIPSDQVDPGFLPPNPRPKIVPNWGGLPAHLDGVVNWGSGKLYAFKGPSYFRYDITLERVDAGYPLCILLQEREIRPLRRLCRHRRSRSAVVGPHPRPGARGHGHRRPRSDTGTGQRGDGLSDRPRQACAQPDANPLPRPLDRNHLALAVDAGRDQAARR